MTATLLLALWALRAGQGLRRQRRLGHRRRPEAIAAHVRVAKLAVLAALVGFLAGPPSMFWLRGRAPFGTVHGVFGLLAAVSFAAAGWLGWRLERRRPTSRDAHAAAGLLGMLLGAAAAVMGFVLLP